MVLMKGTKRVFETPNVETSNSGSIRTVSIYGITSYNDILNCIIPIKSNAVGISGATTLNINNLGAIDIKYYKNGVKSPIDITNWVAIGQIYYVYYDSTDFVLLINISSSSGGTSGINILSVSDLSLLVAGTYTSTQFNSIIDIDSLDYFNFAGLDLLDESTKKDYIVINKSIDDSTSNTVIYKFTIIDDNNILKNYTITNSIQNDTYTVSVTDIDLSLRNGNTIQY